MQTGPVQWPVPVSRFRPFRACVHETGAPRVGGTPLSMLCQLSLASDYLELGYSEAMHDRLSAVREGDRPVLDQNGFALVNHSADYAEHTVIFVPGPEPDYGPGQARNGRFHSLYLPKEARLSGRCLTNAKEPRLCRVSTEFLNPS